MVKLSELLQACGIEKTSNVDGSIFVTGGNTDSRLIRDGNIYFALKGVRSDGHDFIPQAVEAGASVCVVHDDYSNDAGYPVIYSQDVEKTLGKLAYSWKKLHNARIIGITGTNGKTTTKEILGKLLALRYNVISTFKNFNNHIGVPLTLLSIRDDTEYAIVELGTNHFGEIEYLSALADPDLGLITNIGEGHLEQFGDRSGVYSEKIKLFELLAGKGGTIFVNRDDGLLKDWNAGHVISFGMASGADYRFSDLELDGEGYPVFRFRGEQVKMNVPGELNVKNALAAAAIAGELSISPHETASVLSTLTLKDKRYETVKYKNAVVLSDCYNSNPTSASGLLDDLSKIKKFRYIVLGDMLELGGTSDEAHERIVKKASSQGFDEVLLFGCEMKKAYEAAGCGAKVVHYKNFDELKKRFDELTGSGKNIALKGSRGMQLEKLMEDI